MASLTRAFVPWRKLRQSSLQRRNQFGRNGCIELKWCTVHLRSGSVEEAYRLHVSGSVLGLASQGYSFFPTPTLFGCEKKNWELSIKSFEGRKNTRRNLDGDAQTP